MFCHRSTAAAGCSLLGIIVFFFVFLKFLKPPKRKERKKETSLVLEAGSSMVCLVRKIERAGKL